MTTIIERDTHHDTGGDSSAMTMILAVVAIAVIVGLGLLALRTYPFSDTPANDTTPINVILREQRANPNPTPTPTPSPTPTPLY